MIFGNNPIYYADGDGNDLIIKGKNNSSITFKTNLVNFSVNASSLGVNFGGNHILKGEEVLSAALDLAGIVDPTGIADGANAILQAKNGDYFSAGISVIGLFPWAGDLPKFAKVEKDYEIIKTAIEKGAKVLKEGSDELAGAVGKGGKKVDSQKFGGGNDTYSKSKKEAFNKAKDQNGVARSQQPDKQYITKDINTGKPLREYEFTNSYGKQITISKDNPRKYKDGGTQGPHYNAGEKKTGTPKDTKQHYNYGK